MKKHWEIFKVNCELAGLILGMIGLGIMVVVFIAGICLAIASPVLLSIWIIMQMI